jgi:hypothetical protein
MRRRRKGRRKTTKQEILNWIAASHLLCSSLLWGQPKADRTLQLCCNYTRWFLLSGCVSVWRFLNFDAFLSSEVLDPWSLYRLWKSINCGWLLEFSRKIKCVRTQITRKHYLYAPQLN